MQKQGGYQSTQYMNSEGDISTWWREGNAVVSEQVLVSISFPLHLLWPETQKHTHTHTLVLRVHSTRRDTESHQSALFLPLPLERNTDRLTACFSLTSDFTAGPTSSRSRWNSAWWPRSAATNGRTCVHPETPTSCMIKNIPDTLSSNLSSLVPPSPPLSLPEDFRALVKIRSHKKRRMTSLGSGYCKFLPGEQN